MTYQHINDLCKIAESDLRQKLTIHFYDDVDTILFELPRLNKTEYLLVYKQHQELFDKYITPTGAQGQYEE